MPANPAKAVVAKVIELDHLFSMMATARPKSKGRNTQPEYYAAMPVSWFSRVSPLLNCPPRFRCWIELHRQRNVSTAAKHYNLNSIAYLFFVQQPV